MTHLYIYDTTLRDGSQGEGVSFSMEDKLSITRRLDEIGVPFVEGGTRLGGRLRVRRRMTLIRARVRAAERLGQVVVGADLEPTMRSSRRRAR